MQGRGVVLAEDHPLDHVLALQDRAEQRRLRAEVAVHQRHVGVGGRRDHPYRHTVVPVLAEQLARGVQQPSPRRLPVPLGPGSDLVLRNLRIGLPGRGSRLMQHGSSIPSSCK
jgi:hypothetical protein